MDVVRSTWAYTGGLLSTLVDVIGQMNWLCQTYDFGKSDDDLTSTGSKAPVSCVTLDPHAYPAHQYAWGAVDCRGRPLNFALATASRPAGNA